MSKKGTGRYVAGFWFNGEWESSHHGPNSKSIKNIQTWIKSDNNKSTHTPYRVCQIMADGTLQPVEEEEPKSTPGPWEVELIESVDDYQIRTPEDVYIAEVSGKENAHLIAKAPQMEKDLEEAVGLLVDVGLWMQAVLYGHQKPIQEKVEKFLFGHSK